jgi:hypothetical protein
MVASVCTIYLTPSKALPMTKEKKVAWCDWLAGMIIGLMPLLTHFVLWVATKRQGNWADNWVPDLLFVTISNSGLVAVTVFTRLLAGAYDMSSFSPAKRVVWGLTLASFALAAMLYGADVTGTGNDKAWITSLILLIFSAICSINFELAIAGAPKK